MHSPRFTNRNTKPTPAINAFRINRLSRVTRTSRMTPQSRKAHEKVRATMFHLLLMQTKMCESKVDLSKVDLDRHCHETNALDCLLHSRLLQSYLLFFQSYSGLNSRYFCLPWFISLDVIIKFHSYTRRLLSFFLSSSNYIFVEINSTFYRIIHPRIIEAWRRAIPAGFEFSVKCHCSLTHRVGPDLPNLGS
jgi:hypothetical protein